MNDLLITRRQGLGLAAAAAGTVAAPAFATAPAQKIPFLTKVDFKDPKWNRDTFARLEGDLDPTKEKIGWIKGRAVGVRENERVRPLFDVEGFSVVRLKQLEDGSWRKLLREIVFYRDIQTGKIMDSWQNPYTNETVKVVPIANDPFNFTIGEFAPEPPSYGGLNKDKPPRRPLLLDWDTAPNNMILLKTAIDLFYPNALNPAKWVRESSGAMNRVSEYFTYYIDRADIENPRLTHIPHVGAWSRITPWLPWMLMGAAPGHISYVCSYGSMEEGIRGLAPDLVAAARAMDEKWLHAPTEDYGPSLSSLENYARQQTPAPVPAGWAPPQPPAPITLPAK
ncbi:DUF1838 family protein [Sphingomonas hengshuiensis]|uniref:DUF1838 domain-containing protein n=1 Tax=Sphingomonas hengshuiensis TaxID=1609977 RepID=A0A7U4J9P7_9SPHN|nr:DUF1838 family protein [Sphingomonas hengshuiensis]AJP72813.1 hypothetical protein TS85_15055 [Sphingomonas hengshuiensis]